MSTCLHAASVIPQYVASHCACNMCYVVFRCASAGLKRKKERGFKGLDGYFALGLVWILGGYFFFCSS